MQECKVCGCYFHVFWTGVNAPGGKERECVDCPKCETTAFSRMTALFPQVAEATPEEVEAYQSKQKSR